MTCRSILKSVLVTGIKMADEIRLHKFLSQAGVASRREAERWIAAGRVQVNGQVVSEQGLKIDPDQVVVSLDQEPIQLPGSLMYLIFNKPEGCLVTRSDENRGRRIVYDLLPPAYQHLHPVGRLDQDSCGLLLLTNDGDLTQRLLHPRYKMPKLYQVKVNGRVNQATIKELRDGVEIITGQTQPAQIRLIRHLSGSAWLEFIIREGKKRQIRRMCKAVGLYVTFLQRLQIGSLKLGDLAEGECRLLTTAEVRDLRKATGFL